jgi:hypothetical protein
VIETTDARSSAIEAPRAQPLAPSKGRSAAFGYAPVSFPFIHSVALPSGGACIYSGVV